MAWEWVPTVGTVTVALAGIGATLLTTALARRQAEALAAENHREARRASARRDQLAVYADAVAHAVYQERALDRTFASDGEHQIDLSPRPAGGPLTLAPMDEVGVRITLLADARVKRAWEQFVDAWTALQVWSIVEYGGGPDEPDAEILTELRTSISRLVAECRSALADDLDWHSRPRLFRRA